MRTRDKRHACPGLHRQLYNLTLLRYRPPPANATSQSFCLNHDYIVTTSTCEGARRELRTLTFHTPLTEIKTSSSPANWFYRDPEFPDHCESFACVTR